MKLLRLLAFVCVLSSFAHADKLRLHGFGEGALGVSIPVADSSWNTFADATFKFSLRGGLELWLFQRVGFAAEAQIDFIPVKTDDGTYRPNNLIRIDTPFSRFRFLFGGRFLFDFGMGVDEHGRFKGHLKATGVRPKFAEKLADLGIRLGQEVFTPEGFARKAVNR